MLARDIKENNVASRRKTAEVVRVTRESSLTYISRFEKPDPRLVALVQILARRAARDFVQVWDGQNRGATRIEETI